MTKDIGVGHAVGRLAHCLGIPYVQPLWKYAITNLVVDFKLGEGLTRWNEWEDLNGIFRNAVERGYRSSEGDTLPHPDVPEETRVPRPTREEQAPAERYLEHRDAGNIPPDDASRNDESSIWMPDIWKYVNLPSLEGGASRAAVYKGEHIDDVNGLQDLKILGESIGDPPNQLEPGEQSSRGDDIAKEGSGIGTLRYASPLNEVQVHGAINGRCPSHPRRGDTSPIRPPRQLLPNGNSTKRDLDRLDVYKGVQVLQRVQPSDQQGNDQLKRGKTLYEYSWTGI